ncbi:MAG: hypothetical protein IJO43_00360 [Bacilli bacterium]|nr:hypothetical protein [Bacilli bacterium]
MKKYAILILTVLICLSFDVVTAEEGTLKPEEILVTCVYENGFQLEAFYSEGAYGIFGSSIKVSNMIEAPTASGIKIFYNEGNYAKKIVDSAQCPDKLNGGIMIQGAEDVETTATASLYFHADDKSKVSCGVTTGWANGLQYCSDNSSDFDHNFFNKTKISQGFEPKYGYWYTNTVQVGSALEKKCISGGSGWCNFFSFNLLNERVEIATETKPLGQWAFKSEGDQAASKAMYARLYKYKLPNGDNRFFIEKDNIMTSVPTIKEEPDKTGTKTNWLCLKASSKSINESSFYYSEIRHRGGIGSGPVGKTPTCKQDSFTLYKEVDWDEAAATGGTMTSICDIIPETSLILAEFTQWARIIVPAFLIILTGFDISKIVINGNLEEELPKRRKHIIIRAVIALIFFFLPLFVQAIIGATQGVDFGDVSCIWN